MTTMFVQLRGVVYLLVLLQCCVCVAHATDGQSTVENAEGELKKWVKKADELLGKGRGCVTVWKKEEESCNGRISPTKSVADGTHSLVTEIKKKLGGGVITKDQGTGDDDLVEKAKKAMQKTQETVNETKAILAETAVVNIQCSYILEEWRQEMENKDGARKHYVSVIKGAEEKYRTPERIELVEESNKTHKVLSDVMGELAVASKRSSSCTRVVKQHQERAERAMKELEGVSGDVVEQIKEARTHNATVPRESTVKARLDVEWEEEAQAIVKAKEEEEQKKKQAALEKAQAEQRLLAEKEAKEREAELEEQKRRAREQERMAQEELDRKKKAAAEEEAEKRKADEKRAQEEKTKQDQERRDAEEKAQKAREALERKEKEQLERAAEEARKKAEAAKKNDNSHHSPALVQSPLLLILLCVLGCTLVC
ncbi:uncharacterized protein TM35_000251720 [Trypanosoma theileri]|uniref:Transglutaminase n=1 Tax=Trypanosoma theileri TaxID=67003 RepID=A0A1X0NQ82_9TRYP|nr:uncharacterized protein TM35_000251720 [Trypanosoma theileri]ORC86876.1 hypothetical protein TM35_000251720 [Trypanosoma theileri]